MRRSGASAWLTGSVSCVGFMEQKPLCECVITVLKTDSWEKVVSMSLISALRRQTADLCEFEANLIYEVSSRIPELLNRETLSREKNIKVSLEGWLDGSVSIDPYYQNGGPMFDPWHPPGQGEN